MGSATIKASRAMIVWQPLLTPQQRCLAPFDHPVPIVRVFDDHDKAEHRRWAHLPCSLGACLHDWCEKDVMSDLVRAFFAVVDDGIPIAEVHRAFLQIEEWVAMTQGREFFGVTIPDIEEVDT